MTKKKKFKDCIWAEISDIISEIEQSDCYFSCNWKQLAKHFISRFTEENVWQCDFESLKAIYREHFWAYSDPLHVKIKPKGIFDELYENKNKALEEAEKEEETFYQFVCKEHFYISKLPKDLLLENYNKAAVDLATVCDTLTKIQEKLQEIKLKGDKLENQDVCPILYYYEKLNVDAKNQIIEFIANGIKPFVLRKQAMRDVTMKLFFQPYNYSKERYAPRRPHVLDNKLLHLPYPEHTRLKELLKENKDQFDKELKNYIEKGNVLDKLRDSVNHNHILYSRKEFIKEALDLYENSQLILFVNSIPSFIEGVLHDLCLLFGYSENELQGDAFQAKVDNLQEPLSWELCYEYYSFSFRLLRNKISHGGLMVEDVKEYADLLLLDMVHISGLVNSSRIPLNHYLFLIHEIETNTANPDYHYLLDYLVQEKIEIPPFYGITTERLEAIDKMVLTPEFWAFIEKEKEEMYEAKKHGFCFILYKILKMYPDHEPSKALLKELRVKKPNRTIANGYLDELTKDNFK